MSTNNQNDPSGFVSNPPSTIVKVFGTSREEMNNSFGIVVQYNVDRGRYLVHLVKNQTTVLLKPDNLQKANYLEQVQAQFQQLTNDPRIKNEVMRFANQIQNKLPFAKNVPIQYLGIGVLVLLFGLIFTIGFSKTVLILSFTMIVFMIIGPDIMNNASPKVIVQNLPMRFTSVVEQHFPGGSYIAKNKILLIGLVGLILFTFINGMIATSSGAVSTPPQQPNQYAKTTRTSDMKMMEEYYKIGFQDAQNNKEYGTSLKDANRQLLGDELDPNSSPFNVEGGEEDEYIIPPPPPPPSSGGGNGSKLGFGTMMSLFYVYRTIMDLGKIPGGSFSIDLLKANLQTMETWKMGMLGISVFNLCRTFLF